ncbi:MAG: type I glyceraldehyde-3-phosphate dehydrogenase [Thermodesulfobacteriota bacterium]
MSIKIGINGFGRIGRHILRIGLDRKDLEFVGINDITDAATLAHLFKYDSVFRKYKDEVNCDGGNIIVGRKTIRVFSERDPKNIPWNEVGAEIVAESSGIFTTKEKASLHLGDTVKKVIITAPAGQIDFTTVMGINHNDYNPEKHHIISNASCTTNCFSMLVKVLHDNFTIKRGEMTTVHSYTSDQRILDAPHKDLRRARSAALSIIPTSTGAASAIIEVFPELKGKLTALALRVPTPDGSLVDFSCEVEKNCTADEVNAKFREASMGSLKGFLGYLEDEIVSSDIVGDTHSGSFDPFLTSVVDGNLVKVVAWYDNEYGYTSRVVDLIEHVGGKL